MSASLFEIVMLPNGDVVLQRTDGETAPLVRISFSEEAQCFLQKGKAEVARAMIDAGIDAVEQMDIEGELSLNDEVEPTDARVLH